MPEKKYRPKSGNEGLTVEFPTTEGYVRIKPGDWPYAPKDAGEEAYLANLDEVTDRPPTKAKGTSARTSRAKKASGSATTPPAPRSGDGGGNGNEGGEG